MPDNGAAARRTTRTNLDFYHSPTQLRFDTWNRLAEHTSRLREKHLRKADIAALVKKIRDEITLLETIEDLKRNWRLFATPDNPGKGRFYSCPDGWGCQIINANMFKAYGLADTFELYEPKSADDLKRTDLLTQDHEREGDG